MYNICTVIVQHADIQLQSPCRHNTCAFSSLLRVFEKDLIGLTISLTLCVVRASGLGDKNDISSDSMCFALLNVVLEM